ncbi:hypothetical protein BRARA_A02194 [Brassica rapa]|uniref:Uncharacterized protein n=1 Tax=Brassica campestris TaxID=3711 RepID=A0A398ARI6_BRACM|nr:hypothetical protein BRARA_A02194 [Brassica rapa]
MQARALWMKELPNQNTSTDTGYGDILKEDITPSTSSYYNHASPEFLSPRIYAFEPPSIMYRDFGKRQIAGLKMHSSLIKLLSRNNQSGRTRKVVQA